jgi:hypothetical protein
MRADLEQLGVSFQYPDNWVLDESETEAGEGEVAVYSPGGSFWSLAVYPPNLDAKQLASEAMAALKKEYPEADVEPVTETIAGEELAGYDLNFFYLDLTNTALVRSLKTARSNYVIVCQAEDREFERIAPVFRAITTSLLQEAASRK